MKRLCGLAVFTVIFAVAMGSTAFATTSLELVAGSGANYSTLFIPDGGGGAGSCQNFGTSTACSATGGPSDTNGFSGGITVSGIIFDGFNINTTAGGSNTPLCSGLNGPNCLNTTNINATNISSGTATISMYFFSSGFTPAGGLKVGFSTPGETGSTATQTAYATSGAVNPLQLGTGVLDPTAGLTACGSSLTFSGSIGASSSETSCGTPGSPYSLELATTMTAAPGQGFNLNGNISFVPEPAAVTLFGTVLALLASVVLRRKRTSSV